MDAHRISRRSVLAAGGMTIAGMALNRLAGLAAPLQAGDEVLPWVDQPADNPVPQIAANLLTWESVDSWITPKEKFFSIAHYNRPEIDARTWRLEVSGQVRKPLSLSLDQVKARGRRDLTCTVECSGNHGLPFLWGAIGTARWTGISLSTLLREASLTDKAREVVFWGSDAGEETVREVVLKQNFARSLSVQDALNPNNLLAYEMNGAALPQPNGFPLRLVVPGWYGIANVKWLRRIEVLETRLMNRFMARDYVTLRKNTANGETEWTESSVGRGRLKSAPVRVVRNGSAVTIQGAAWGAPINLVEVKIDNGPWQRATIDTRQSAEFAWKFWTLNWPAPAAGEHSITTRATDTSGNVQPSPEDPIIANKQTYWESNGQITRRVKIT